MDHATRDDRNPFFPPEHRSTFGLTLGMFATVLVATVVAVGLFVAQLDAFASTPHTGIASTVFSDPIRTDGTDACATHHVLRFEPVTAVDVPVTDLALAHAELVATCKGEEPHAVLSADCMADPVGRLVVLASGNGPAPMREHPTEAFGEPMHSDPLLYGGADPHTLFMIERVADGNLAEGSV